jgi:hypothetical protein
MGNLIIHHPGQNSVDVEIKICKVRAGVSGVSGNGSLKPERTMRRGQA